MNSQKKITLYYFILGISWIYFSDRALDYFFKDHVLCDNNWANTIKGLLFVTITSLLLYKLINKYFDKLSKSEKDYRNMFDANPNPMYIYDLKSLKFIEVNKAAIKNYGYSKQEFLSKTVLDIRPDTEKERLLSDILSSPKRISYDEPWIHILKNGEQIKVNVHAYEINYKGKSARLVLAVDISEQLLIKEQLKQQQEKLQAQNIKLLQSLETIELHKNKLSSTQKIAKIAGWEFNMETETLVPNSGFLEVLNLDKEEGACLKILKTYILEKDKQKFEHFISSFNIGITVNECVVRFKKEKELRYILFAATLKDPKKQKNAVEGYIKDVTEITLKDQLIHKTLERFEQLALSTNDALYEWDIESSVIRLTGNIDSIMGYGVKEAIHPEKWWVDRMHPTDFIENDNLFREAVEQRQQTLKRKYRFKTLNGVYKLIYDQSIIKYNAQNEVEKVIGSIQDVEELTKINQENKRLLDIISKVNNFIIITDVNGFIDWVNPAFTELTEYTLEEVKGKKPGLLLQGPESNKEVIMRMSTALKEKNHFTEEIINYSKSGRKYWLKIDCNPIYDDNHHHVGFIAIESEITERKLREVKIEKQNEILKKTALFNSHEVRRPLASILGIIELLKYENSESTKNQLIKLLEKCSEELDTAIRNSISLTEFNEEQPLN
ncbi:PAS domain S-box protein [Pedobacter aquae]|uniref:histidine kinase n=1 Tax=Pedobacter aquae TaxID=2605747 RepID=A0A5C0VL20_9SPHI|nr:PAS domain S-box protein [Pedobacter aquae]QEK52602.1 PAS domain S-box protein [Pedobacter aquae]